MVGQWVVLKGLGSGILIWDTLSKKNQPLGISEAKATRPMLNKYIYDLSCIHMIGFAEGWGGGILIWAP